MDPSCCSDLLRQNVCREHVEEIRRKRFNIGEDQQPSQLASYATRSHRAAVGGIVPKGHSLCPRADSGNNSCPYRLLRRYNAMRTVPASLFRLLAVRMFSMDREIT